MSEKKLERLFNNQSNYFTETKNDCSFTSTKSEKFSFLIRIKSKYFKNLNYLLVSMVIGIIIHMFHVKNEVQDLNFELKQINGELSHAKNHLGLLKAELAYLNSPDRIQALANQYLHMQIVQPKQFVNKEKKSNHLGISKFLELANKNSSKTWRYNRDGNEIHTVAIKRNIER